MTTRQATPGPIHNSTEPVVKQYEQLALGCIDMSDARLGEAQSITAQVYATQAQVYATLALLHSDGDLA